MSELMAFQDAFVDALAGDLAALQAWLDPQGDNAGLVVYRNTIAKGCADALADNFPTVRTLLGDDWFAAAAAAFVREVPPSSAVLQDYGEPFPTWLDRFPPAQDLPYIAGVAHLDRLWTEALFAAEAPHLDATALAAVAPEALATARVRLHPSVRFAAFDAGLPGLWQAVRAGSETLELSEAPQAILLLRRHGAVVSRLLGQAEAAFFRACRAGASLGEAAQSAAQADPDAPIASLFAALIADGVFTGFTLETVP